MPKLQKMGKSSVFVIIPIDIIKKIGWKSGDALLVTLNESNTLKVEKI